MCHVTASLVFCFFLFFIHIFHGNEIQFDLSRGHVREREEIRGESREERRGEERSG
jgi:hypothetical protein